MLVTTSIHLWPSLIVLFFFATDVVFVLPLLLSLHPFFLDLFGASLALDMKTLSQCSMLRGSFFGCVSSVSKIPLVLVPSHQKLHRRLCLPFITPTNHPADAFGLGHSSLFSCGKLGTENDSRKPCHHFAVNSKCSVTELTVCAQLDHGGFPRDYQNLLLVCSYSCVSLHSLDIVFPCIVTRVFSDFMENELFISSSYVFFYLVVFPHFKT